jgi:hypothetical protein
MDLANGNLNGLAPGTSGGDQVFIQEEAGPDDDRRPAIRPAFDDAQNGFSNEYLNFAITGQALGPSSQPNARLAICVTYFDSADLSGQRFGPEVYRTERNGAETFGVTAGSSRKTLDGTGLWREAYFELPDVKFTGVNQGPQAAARFQFSGKIYLSRVQYAVIRPCGPDAGVNLLDGCKGVRLSLAKQADGKLRFSWPKAGTGYALETSPVLGPDAQWTALADVPSEDGDSLVILLNAAAPGYYRLVK